MCIYCGIASHQPQEAAVSSTEEAPIKATSAFTSSAYYINALLLGYSWTGGTGTAAHVNYTYAISTTSNDAENGLSGGAVLNQSQHDAAEQAFQSWENVANIQFTEGSSSSPIFLRQAVMPSGIAGWMDPTLANSTTFASADVVFDSDYTRNPTQGSYPYTIFLHELGHALGLKHPGNYSTTDTSISVLPTNEDSTNVSVMSYYGGSAEDTSGYPVSPMLYDIAAAQFLYGANTSYNAGNTTYVLTGSRINHTIWDGGGVDTLDSTSYTGGAVILDLRAGKDDITRVGETSQWIAYNANIENAISGNGADTLYGNDLNNTLIAGSGADILYGFEGSDILYGNQDNDTLYGGHGSDTLYGGKANDTIYGGVGSIDSTDSGDIIFGGENSDIIYGNSGNDILYGGTAITDPTDGNDTLYGGIGDDIIYGNGGDDTLYGNGGNDTMYGGAGSDNFFFTTADGADVIHGFQPAEDVLYISSTIFVNSQDALAHSFYNAVGAVVDFGNNNNLNLTGLVPGSLGVQHFIIS